MRTILSKNGNSFYCFEGLAQQTIASDIREGRQSYFYISKDILYYFSPKL